MKPLDPRLVRHARPTVVFLAGSVLIGLATAGLVIGQAVLLADAVSRVFLGQADLASLRWPLLLLAAVVVGRGGLAWAQQVLAHHSSAAVKSRLRRLVLDHAARLGPGWLTGERTGELGVLVTRGVDALDGYFSAYLPQLVLACVVPPTVLAVIGPADWVSALTIGATLPLVPVFMILIGLHTRARVDRQWRTLSRLGGHFLDVVAGLPTLKVFGRSRAQANTIARVTEEYRRATLSTLRVAFLSSLVLEVLCTLSVALVAVSVGLRLLGGELDLRTALLVLVLAPEAYLPLRQVGARFHDSAEGVAAAERVFAVLETPVPASGTRTDVPDPARAGLRVDRVTVGYPDRDRPALDRVSLWVPPGQVTVLTGPSGCGKSTLLAVLLGFVRPEQGLVTVGGQDLAGLDPVSWRRQVAWVPQRPTLLTGTVLDNVRLGTTASVGEVESALRSVGLPPGSLPDGVHTWVADGGVGLSAGQRQRVALARAVLRDARLVLLDEPTSHLDADSEAVVLAAIARLTPRRTVLAVAHRPSVLTIADQVVRLDPGPGVDIEPGADIEALGSDLRPDLVAV